jgi:hypothetical protein
MREKHGGRIGGRFERYPVRRTLRPMIGNARAHLLIVRRCGGYIDNAATTRNPGCQRRGIATFPTAGSSQDKHESP